MASRPPVEHRKKRHQERLILERPSDESVISQSRLHQILDYDQYTGIFRRKIAGGGVKAEQVVGTINNGYLVIRVGGHRYKAHRLAFLWMIGAIPDEVDHKNRDRSDNRWANLRAASSRQNAANRPTWAGKQLPRGVYRRGNKFRAGIFRDSKQYWLGTFDSVEEAANAYHSAALGVHGEFASVA